MSMCLAYFTGSEILLAAEGFNLPVFAQRNQAFTFHSKIVILQPGFALICTGQMGLWADIVNEYVKQSNFQAVASHVHGKLQSYGVSNDHAYCRICGFHEGAPNFLRIDKDAGKAVGPISDLMPMKDLVTVGWYHQDAYDAFHQALRTGFPPMRAMVHALEILETIPGIRLPVHVRTLKGP